MQISDVQMSRIDTLFSAFDNTRSPGCSIAAGADGQVIFSRCYGMANLDHDIPIRRDTVFRVASVSKQFTAASIALLVADGALNLDDPVRSYLDEFPEFSAPVTIRQLAHHTSGVRDQWDLLGLTGWRYSEDRISNQDVMSVLARQKSLNFVPGSEHLYSNSGYTAMAEIVARVSGMSFRAFTDRRIFKPLGMTRTFFRDDFREVVWNQAYGYVPVHDEPGRFRLSVTNFDTVGATSLVTTPEDLLQWGANLDNPTVGGPELVERLTTKTALTDGTLIDYALGISVGEILGLETYSHGGADAGYRAFYLHVPEHRLTLALACNVPMPVGDLVLDILGILYPERVPAESAPAEEEPIELTTAEIAAFAGQYISPDDMTLTFASVSGALQAEYAGHPISLTPLSDRRFAGDGIEGQFTADGQTFTITKGFPGPVSFERTPIPVGMELSEFVGQYQAEELVVPYEVALDDGDLTISLLKRPGERMQPVRPDVFSTAIGTLRFRRDDRGVTGFSLSTGRIRGLEFTRQGDAPSAS